MTPFISEVLLYLKQSASTKLNRVQFWRDDSEIPASDTSKGFSLLMGGANAFDKDIGSGNFDIWLFSSGNATNSQLQTLLKEATALQAWITANHKHNRIYNVRILQGVSQPIKDGQGRWGVSIHIQAMRNTDKPE